MEDPSRPWSVSSFVKSAALVCVALAASATTACAPKAKGPPVRAASRAGDVPHEVLFSPQIALATAEDAVVRILTPQMSCTGTLIDDDLVLTSHHCVVERGARGEFTSKTLKGKDFRIELGGDYLPWGSVTVKSVVAPPCGETGGGGDVAILVLSRKLVGMPTMTPQLDEPPKIGEMIDPIGFGRCATSADGIRRHVRMGGGVNALSGETVHVVASICPGDSGGPVVLRGTRTIVGVISLSAMDGDERTTAPSIMARIDAFRAVFNNARLIADGLSAAELPPIECR